MLLRASKPHVCKSLSCGRIAADIRPDQRADGEKRPIQKVQKFGRLRRALSRAISPQISPRQIVAVGCMQPTVGMSLLRGRVNYEGLLRSNLR